MTDKLVFDLDQETSALRITPTWMREPIPEWEYPGMRGWDFHACLDPQASARIAASFNDVTLSVGVFWTAESGWWYVDTYVTEWCTDGTTRFLSTSEPEYLIPRSELP